MLPASAGQPDVIAAAHQVDSVRAVASIDAPYEPAHVEHTCAFLEDGVWVLTAEDGGRSRLGELVAATAAA